MQQIWQSSTNCRKILVDYKNVFATSTRFYRLKKGSRESIRTKDPNPHLSTGTFSIKETKKPNEKYFETELSSKDVALIGRSDFVGVKSIDEKAYRKISPENAFSKIQEQLGTNRRVNAEFFMINVLIQLENKNAQIKETILRRPDFYIPMIIRCCGNKMADLHRKNRTKMLYRLIAALKSNDIPLSLPSINAILTTKLENDHSFDTKQILDMVEHKQKLTPDINFFNCLFWQLAKDGDLQGLEFNKLRDLCVQRGIQPDKQTDLAEIYFLERRALVLKSEPLIRRFASRYGEENKFEALGVACCGAAKGGHVRRLRVLLRKSVFTDPELGRYILKIPQDAVFDILWRLAENSEDGMGKQWASVSQQILDHCERSRGFFKQLFSEAERQINHRYFYSAIVMFEDMYRIRYNFENQQKTIFSTQIYGRLANRMVASKLETSTIIELANRMLAFMGKDFRFFDNIVLAVLTYRHTTPMEKFEQFRLLVDMIDPSRERIHIILPLVACCPNLVSRYMMLFRCSNLGYKNISDLNSFVIFNIILKPFFRESRIKYKEDTDLQHLQGLANALKSYGIPLKDVWLLLFNVLKDQRDNVYHTGVSDKIFSNWLATYKDTCFPKEDVVLEQRLAEMNYPMLKRLVMDERNPEKVHDFLKKREFPPDTNFEEITEPLLYLYIETANWSYLQKLLQLLSQRVSKYETVSLDEESLPSEKQKNYVKNYHLLLILRRKLDELPTPPTLTSLIEYAYELRRLFPTAVADFGTFFETIAAYRRLFYAIVVLQDREFSTKYTEQIIELLTTLVRLDIINLHSNETLTPFIVDKVLTRLGWVAAVETWMKFQVAFNCSNGILELFRHAIKQRDSHKMAFVSHKAKTFISSSRVETFLAAAYVLLGRQEDAANVLKNANSPVSSYDVVPVFRLTNALLSSRNIVSMFPIKFLTICLEHTDLSKNEKALQLCNYEWIRGCERFDQGENALKFMDLFKSYGVHLDKNELQSVQQILKNYKNTVSKWVVGSKSLLNLDNLKDSEALQTLKTLDEKLKEIEVELSSKCDQTSPASATTKA